MKADARFVEVLRSDVIHTASLLVRDHNPGAYAVRVYCVVCGVMFLLSDMVIDAEGPAFAAYYCRDHVPAGDVSRCTRRDCARGN